MNVHTYVHVLYVCTYIDMHISRISNLVIQEVRGPQQRRVDTLYLQLEIILVKVLFTDYYCTINNIL